jgi:hypothetical protein
VADSVVIDRRFNGPPDSGNGGYTCGLLAGFVEGPASVSLRKPPPLGVPLAVVRDGGDGNGNGNGNGGNEGGLGVRLMDGDELVADAEPAPADPAGSPPEVVPLDEARAAIEGSAFLSDTHPFPSCFVCGPRRDEGDGLRIFPGWIEERGVFAAPWTPDPSLATGDGSLPDEIVWSALDCPTSAPGLNSPGPDGTVLPIVLARLTADLREPVAAGEEHVIASWEIGRDGRKREAGAALYDSGGRVLASARALWIELRPST